MPPRRTALMQLSSAVGAADVAGDEVLGLVEQRAVGLHADGVHADVRATVFGDASRMYSMGSTSFAFTTSAPLTPCGPFPGGRVPRRCRPRASPRAATRFSWTCKPTGPQPNTATVSPPFGSGPVDAGITGRENVGEEEDLLVGKGVRAPCAGRSRRRGRGRTRPGRRCSRRRDRCSRRARRPSARSEAAFRAVVLRDSN